MNATSSDKGRVLIVEDEPVLAQELTKRLRGWGYDVAGTASCGEEAVRMAIAGRPNLVLMDIALGKGMDGIEAAADIASHVDTAIVYLTGYTQRDVFDRARATEPFAYITKPVSPDELERTLEMAMCRHDMEQRLRASENRFRLAMEATNDGIWDWNILTDDVYRSPAFTTMLGFAPEEFPPGFAEWTKRIHDDDRERVLTTLQNYLSGTNRDYAVEFRMKHKSGRDVWVLSRGKVVQYDEAGKPVRMIGTHTDITEQKKAEAALAESEALLNATGRMAKVGGWELDPDTRTVRWTEQTYRIHEVPLGHDPPLTEALSFFHPEDRPKLEGAIQRAIDYGEPYDMELRFRTARGAPLWTHTICKPVVREGRTVKLVGTFQDITDRIGAYEALRESEDKFRRLFELSPDVHVIYDYDGYIDCNDACVKLLGLTGREDLISRQPVDISPAYQLDGQLSAVKAKAMIEIAFRNGTHRFDWVCRKPDGTPVYLDIVANRVILQGREVIHAMARDVTDEKRAQQLAVQAEKYKAVADLSAGVAHNFNNLLQIVIGNAELGLMDIQSGDFQSIEDKLTEVREASRFGAETIRRLNRFVRQVEPGGKDEIQLFDLSDAVRTVVTMSRPLWSDEPKKKGLSLNLECRVQDGCTIHGSKGDLFEVILNLIKNAVEALPDGGDIEIVTLREKNHVVLSVRDTGIGIPASKINRLFTPFFTTSLEAGRGLGLSTCRTIIDAHGGNIRVDSTEGTGTTFTIRLPFVFEQDDTAEEADLVNPLNPLHILVIDDMEGTVRLLKSGLGKMGHVVFTALSGEQGLALLEDNPVDVVICDLGMPGMNGWQVGEAIKRRCAEGGMTKPKFIILTGWGGQSAEKDNIAASGVDAVVEKPVDMAKLLDVVRNVMEANES